MNRTAQFRIIKGGEICVRLAAGPISDQIGRFVASDKRRYVLDLARCWPVASPLPTNL